jgi:hypothetical protein
VQNVGASGLTYRSNNFSNHFLPTYAVYWEREPSSLGVRTLENTIGGRAAIAVLSRRHGRQQAQNDKG